ncbi:PREDICTED: LEAF RUST 10 DISEASE-RESISTANCE LOCUS RECEPTOR-LIKE PROTEIN [Prunus dulcis]|uniref:PREDICTED: LEAF RUST 10 DISEASE-RESISTANCE LOCUS RECEPTOR-LIKE PROTEIN n=1 Tax=Prunus dulcis TaxID=3755 RepID=A0A5E4GLX4_PRUDU|nr:PREDICTED: LEAF RUST 10 DISEASE-RESISTANCE LOCUS RECEPTOR-LIKE PROTEIN [Prunus dulcis]
MITTKNIKFRILEMNSSTHTVTVADGLSGTPASWTFITQDCPAYKRNISVSYATGSTVIDLMNCESVVHVPVFDTAAKDLENNEKDINDVLELGLKTDNDQCSRCEGSGGKCGYNSTDSRFIFFCQNQA